MAKTAKKTENGDISVPEKVKTIKKKKKAVKQSKELMLRREITDKLSRVFGTTPEEANPDQIYKAVLLSVKDILSHKRTEFKQNVKNQEGKKVYYLCMEFLIGKSLKNNLCNLGIEEEYAKILKSWGYDIEDLYEHEDNPGLGNGGLGRLAACFMDALTSLDYSATGFSILYEYGFFKQKIVDGQQIELPDIWLPSGECWLVPRTDKTCTVRFGGNVSEKWTNGKCEIIHTDYTEVQAVPYDIMISGADSEAVNSLRLWKAVKTNQFNMGLFSQGDYFQALEESNKAEIISKVLYPADNHDGGRTLRLKQQYFLVCASLQSIIADHLRGYGTLENFADKVAIHINDTHPALVVPELIRILIDTYSYSWEDAWDIVTKTVSYTNHTVLPEALETWDEGLFRYVMPRIHQIVCEINRRFCADLWNRYPGDWDRITHMSIIANNRVKMANLSVVGSHTVNGVSKLHSDILKKTVFSDFHDYTPEKFTNVTNGIAHRRWLCYSNPGLCSLLDETIGTDYRKSPEKMSDFLKYKDDTAVLDRLYEIKRENKRRFSNWYAEKSGILIDPDSIFDVHVKRMHEYKRQMLNVLRIISYYEKLKENPDADVQPQTFIFAAKAAPSYFIAKQTIRLINEIAAEIEKDKKIGEKMKVVFAEDYNVSLAETLIPAADISEQISLAGKEASGTGNMKLMINGALTLGTLDGANVEIAETVGPDNVYIFGLTTPEVDDLWRRGYHSIDYYNGDSTLKKAVDSLKAGFNGVGFADFYNYLLMGPGVPDPYMCLADFESYLAKHGQLLADYTDRRGFMKKSLVNIASAGRFSADRAIREYAENIWHIKPIKAENNK